MLEFTRLYREAGLAPPEDGLPDHLTVVLEFAATANQNAGTAMLVQHHAGLTLLTSALRDQGSRYVHALGAVLETLPEPTEATMRAAAGIAATGPPQETVGITPFTTGAANQPGARR